MKQHFPILLLSIFTLGVFGIAAAAEKPRVFVLTDIENEPDDAMSMVRFLVYANQWDVEGLAATTSVHQKNKVAAWRIREIVDAYAKVRDNLELHEPGFPSADALRAVIVEGRPDFGMAAVGNEMDSAASELLIRIVDRKDPRPLWVPVWGGPNVLAQALWKVRATRSAKELQRFVAKLRVYTISDQDDSGAWIRKTFPELFYIASPGVHAGGAYHYATWSGISGDQFHGRFTGADFSIVDNPWLDEHIRSKGPARGTTSAHQVHDGRRHAQLSQSHLHRLERSRTPGLGRLGRTLRVLHAAHAQVVSRTGNAAILVRR
jgi:hypothetical protein